MSWQCWPWRTSGWPHLITVNLDGLTALGLVLDAVALLKPVPYIGDGPGGHVGDVCNCLIAVAGTDQHCNVSSFCLHLSHFLSYSVVIYIIGELFSALQFHI